MLHPAGLKSSVKGLIHSIMYRETEIEFSFKFELKSTKSILTNRIPTSLGSKEPTTKLVTQK